MSEDLQLVKRIKQGDGDALRKIYTKYGPNLLTMASGMLRDRYIAEDVLHDVFLSFVENIHKFKLTGTLMGYLATCVANLAKDKMRNKHYKQISLDRVEKPQAKESIPEKEVIMNEKLEIIFNAMNELSDQQKQVILLHLKGELTFKEVSRIEDISLSTAQARYRYGIQKLRVLLNGHIKEL